MDIVIRQFRASDIAAIVSLFYETVHAVNKRDYAREQLEAWAPPGEEAERAASWLASLARNRSCVAEIGGQLVGFRNCVRLDNFVMQKLL